MCLIHSVILRSYDIDCSKAKFYIPDFPGPFADMD